MYTRFLFSFVIVISTLLVGCSSAKKTTSSEPAGWQNLGEKRVDYKIDLDVLNVTHREGTFKKLRFVVRGGSLNMHRCVVRFENGSTQEINLKHAFTRGSNSRVIDLVGNQRFIESISFWYDTKNFSDKKAILVVWGK